MGITDEMLMAYADGQLAAAEASEVERAIAVDEALATRVALMADTRRVVQQAYGAAPPVSADLEARVRSMIAADAAARQDKGRSNVVDLAARRRVVPFWQLPLAAGLALAVGAGSVWLASQPGAERQQMAGLQVGTLADSAVTEALATLPSGAVVDLGDGARMTAIATFRDEADRLCREVEHDRAGATVVAVACHEGGAWDLRFAIASAAADGDGYVPASSLETLDAYLVASGAGAPLSAEDEAAALRTLD
jgi:anti-sigma factor RsiW